MISFPLYNETGENPTKKKLFCRQRQNNNSHALCFNAVSLKICSYTGHFSTFFKCSRNEYTERLVLDRYTFAINASKRSWIMNRYVFSSSNTGISIILTFCPYAFLNSRLLNSKISILFFTDLLLLYTNPVKKYVGMRRICSDFFRQINRWNKFGSLLTSWNGKPFFFIRSMSGA